MRALVISGVVAVLGCFVLNSADAGPGNAGTKPSAPGSDAEAAEKLFDEGRELKDHGKLDEACAKFELALARNRNAVGTILNVALCDEQAGKIASAWKLFTEARDRAAELRLDEHRRAAADHIEKLKDRVPHLTLAFAEKPTTDTKIVVDNAIVTVDQHGDVPRVPLDPGERTVVINAPGRVAYETKLMVIEGHDAALAIPRLAFPVTVHNGRRNVVKVLTYSGIGLVAVGIGIGLYARHLYKDQFVGSAAPCTGEDTTTPICSTEGYNNTQSARTYGFEGTGIGALGLVAVGIGSYLWFFGPADSERLAVVPALAPDLVGLTAVGHF